MATVRTAIFARLTGDTTISGLLAKRVYPHVAPKAATRPYITYFVVGADHQHHLTAAAGLVAHRVQIDMWADTAAEAETLSEAVREALQGLYGTLVTGFTSRGISLASEFDNYEPPSDADETGIYRITHDYEIWHTETVPTL